MGGRVDLTYTGAVRSGPRAFEEAGLTPADVDYVSIYDSFTITVLMTLEDLGFCAKGEGGRFVMDGRLVAPHGGLPFNTDGGGLCNNHPANRGGMTKVIEAVRQLRGEATPAVQVPGLPDRPGPRHRRHPVDADDEPTVHPEGGWTDEHGAVAAHPAAAAQPRDRAVLGRLRGGSPVDPALRRLRRADLVPA